MDEKKCHLSSLHILTRGVATARATTAAVWATAAQLSRYVRLYTETNYQLRRPTTQVRATTSSTTP